MRWPGGTRAVTPEGLTWLRPDGRELMDPPVAARRARSGLVPRGRRVAEVAATSCGGA